MLHAEVDTVQQDRHCAVPMIGIGFANASNSADNASVVEHDV